jgi:hypothetical protein
VVRRDVDEARDARRVEMLTERKGRGIDDEGVVVIEQLHDMFEHGRINIARVRELFERVASKFDVGIVQYHPPARCLHRAASSKPAQREHPVANIRIAETCDEERQARVVAVETRAKEVTIGPLY